MSFLNKMFGGFFRITIFMIGLPLMALWWIMTQIEYCSSDEYRYESVIGKTFPIINNLDTWVDIGDSSLKVLENGDISIKFQMFPTENRVFQLDQSTGTRTGKLGSRKSYSVNFSLRDSDGYVIHTFGISEFVRGLDDNDEVIDLTYDQAYEQVGSVYRSEMKMGLIYTDRIVLDSWSGIELMEKSQNNLSLLDYNEMSLKDRIRYVDKRIRNIKVGMTYDEMVVSMGGIKPQEKSKGESLYKGSCRYGNYVVYFHFSNKVKAIQLEKL